MGTSAKVLKNIFWLALEPGLRLLIAIPLAGFVAHKLGVTSYGEFNFALSFAMLFSVVPNLGLTEVLLRKVAREPGDLSRLWSSTLALKGVLLLAYLGVLWLASWLFGHSQALLVLILLLGLYQGILSLDNTARAIFGGNQEMKAIAGLASFKTVAEVLVTVIVLLLGAHAYGLAVSRVGLGLVGLVATLLLTFRHFGIRLTKPSAALAMPLLGPGLGFAAATALWSVNSRIGILILERVGGVDAVGLFTAAMGPVERIFLFLPAIEVALFPFFSSIRDDEPERLVAALSRAMRYQAILSVGLGVGVSVLGPWMLTLVFPRAFSPAIAILEVLGAGVVVRSMRTLLSTAVGARGGERALAWITGVQCVVTIGVSLAFVRSHGPVGLAWAIAAAELVALILFLGVLSRRHSLSFLSPGTLLGPAAAGLAAFLPFHLVPGAKESLLLPVAFAALFPVGLLLTGSVTREDRAYFMDFVTKKTRA
jgi:O-antigen/teichoic acid export membrane protein